MQPIDQVAAEAGAQALRIHLNRAEAVPSIAALLAQARRPQPARRSPCACPMMTGREIDLTLPSAYPVTPQIKGAIKAMQGVVMVEEV